MSGGGRTDSGAYVLLTTLASASRLEVGRLGIIELEPGVLAYVGSGMRALRARVTRHLAREKPLRWHIDWLTVAHPAREALVLPCGERIECALGAWLAGLGWRRVAPGFGSSDCRCPTHLLHHEGQVKADELRAALPPEWREGAVVVAGDG